MTKTIATASAFCALSFCVPVLAGSGEINGIWQMSADAVLDGSVAPNAQKNQYQCNSHANMFTCLYTGADASNDSNFVGETYTARTTQIIRFLQTDATYYANYSGRRVATRKFIGTWYDVEGRSGDFQLSQ